MKLRDFRIGWRLLVQEPAYSAVVVLGLSVGFAACFLLLGFVRYSFSYDAQVPDAQPGVPGQDPLQHHRQAGLVRAGAAALPGRGPAQPDGGRRHHAVPAARCR